MHIPVSTHLRHTNVFLKKVSSFQPNYRKWIFRESVHAQTIFLFRLISWKPRVSDFKVQLLSSYIMSFRMHNSSSYISFCLWITFQSISEWFLYIKQWWFPQKINKLSPRDGLASWMNHHVNACNEFDLMHVDVSNELLSSPYIKKVLQSWPCIIKNNCHQKRKGHWYLFQSQIDW